MIGKLENKDVPSLNQAFDLHATPFKDATLWPDTRPGKSDRQQTDKRWLHGDYKDAPFRLTHVLYEEIKKISEKK